MTLSQDTSEPFIKLCQQAKDRGLLDWEPKIGHWTDKGRIISHSGALFDLASDRITGTPQKDRYTKDELIYLPSVVDLLGRLPKDEDFSLFWWASRQVWLLDIHTGGFKRFQGESPEQALLKALLGESNTIENNNQQTEKKGVSQWD